jgi:hypothetical protein
LISGILKHDAPNMPPPPTIPEVKPHIQWKEPAVEAMYKYPPLIPWDPQSDTPPEDSKGNPESIKVTSDITKLTKRDALPEPEKIKMDPPEFDHPVLLIEDLPLEIPLVPYHNSKAPHVPLATIPSPAFPVHNLHIQARATPPGSEVSSASGRPNFGAELLALPLVIFTFLQGLWQAFEAWENPHPYVDAQTRNQRNQAGKGNKGGNGRLHARNWNVHDGISMRTMWDE